MVAPQLLKNMVLNHETAKAAPQPLSCWADVGGQRMHYLTAGSGPPLLLVHGLLGGSFCWRYNLPVLSQCYTVYAVDMVGLGLSDAAPSCDCSMPAQAARLAQFMDAVGLRNAAVVGSSWGGAVVLFLAAMNANLRSLVLAAPVNPWSALGHERIQFFGGRMAGFLVPRLMPFSRRFQRPFLERLYADPGRIPPGTLEGYSQLLTRRGRGYNVVNILRGWRQDLDRLGSAIPQVRTPSLLIWGEHDLAVDPRSAQRLLQALPGSELALLPDVGHLPFEESPLQFNRLVLEFLGKTG